MTDTKIKQILFRLMSDKGVNVSELARCICLPQPTVYRIAAGICEHPHLSSLKPLADFFAITVNQLKGLEPIASIDHAIKVPLLTWDQAINKSFDKIDVNNSEQILTDAKVGLAGYALKVKDASMEPVFPKGTLLIADPKKQPKDRSYVIAKLINFPEPIFRQLLIDAQEHYLKPLSPDFERYKMTRLENNDKILSVVVQAKRDYEE
jgi:SOS-response transcriptional repressor LexA